MLFGGQPADQVMSNTPEDHGNAVRVTVPSAVKPGPVKVEVVMKTGERYEVPGEYTYEKPANPEGEPVVPEGEPVVPEEEPVVPEEEPVVPDEEPVVPEEEPVVPDQEPVVPEEEPVVPDQEPVVPEEETQLNEAQAEGDGLTPGGGS